MKTEIPEKVMTGFERQRVEIAQAIRSEQDHTRVCRAAEEREEELAALVGPARAAELQVQRRTNDPGDLQKARKNREDAEYAARSAREFAQARSAELDMARAARIAAEEQMAEMQRHADRLRGAIPTLEAEVTRLERKVWELREEATSFERLRVDRLATRAAYHKELHELVGEE
jgi:hypothetical protein